MVPMMEMVPIVLVTPIWLIMLTFKSPSILMLILVKPKGIRSYQVSQRNKYP